MTAFSRNLGWTTEAEQRLLRQKRVAIAGLGGVGGSHLMTLTRLGIGQFTLADLDEFELANFNRQAGATLPNVGKPKVDAMVATAREVNPELSIRVFPRGVDSRSAYSFLDEVDVYVDGLDFFAFEARCAVFAECARRRIPAVTAAPLGMGVALLNFLPGGMTFEQYFGLEGRPEIEQSVRFLLGLAPAALYRGYLVDRTRIDLAARRGPSTGIACELCAGVAGAQVLKILLRRGPLVGAPRGLHFDAYRNEFSRTHLPRGNATWTQRAKIAAAMRVLAMVPPLEPPPTAVAAAQPTPIRQVLDAARWAPSGDNTQVWRFEITGASSCVVHARDTRDRVVYDVDGNPSRIAVGALLENIRIAASARGLRAQASRRPSAADARELAFDVALAPDATVTPDPLAPYIPIRSVQRRPMSTRALTGREKEQLAAAAGDEHEIVWFESLRGRWAFARLLAGNSRLRLTMPEGFDAHRAAIEWNAQFSADRMPDESLGLGPLTRLAARWTMQSRARNDLANRFLGGAVLPPVELDVLPALGCAAHFVIAARRPPGSIDDYVAAGRVMQRVWLTATRLDLSLQPETTPLIFAAYVSAGRRFSSEAGAWERAVRVTTSLRAILGYDVLPRAVFMARIGHGPAASSRALRRPLEQLALEAP